MASSAGPPIGDGMIKLSAAQLSALLEGVAWAQVERRDVPTRVPHNDRAT